MRTSVQVFRLQQRKRRSNEIIGAGKKCTEKESYHAILNIIITNLIYSCGNVVFLRKNMRFQLD